MGLARWLAARLRQLGRRERVLLALLASYAAAWCAARAAVDDRRPQTSAGAGWVADLRQELRELRGNFETERAIALAEGLRCAEDAGFIGVRRDILRLGLLHSSKGEPEAALQLLDELSLRAAGTALGAQARLSLAHVERRSRGLLQARASYRAARDDPNAQSEHRDEAQAWWTRSLCALGRHAQAREEWNSLAKHGATERWRRHARAWQARCERDHDAVLRDDPSRSPRTFFRK